MIIRRARVSDARQLAEAHIRSMRATYRGLVPQSTLDSLSVDENEERKRQQLATGGNPPFVAEAEGRVIGFAVIGDDAEEDEDGPTGQLYAIYLDPAWWRQGAGRLLWEKVIEEARSAGWTRLTVKVAAANARACRFYEAMGCSVIPGSISTREYLGTTIETVIYQLPL